MMAFRLLASQCEGQKKVWGAVLPCTPMVRFLGFRCTRRKRYPLTLNLNLILLAPFRDRSKVRTTCFSVLGPLNPLDVSKVVVLKIITLWMVTLTTKDPLEVHAIRQMARAPPGVNATCLPKVKDPLEALVIPLLKTKDPREVNATLLLDFSQGGVKDVGRVLPEVLRPPMGVLRMNLLHLKIPEWVEVVPRSIQEDLTRSMITKGVMGRRKTLSSNTTGRACSQVDLSPEGGLYCRPLCRGRNNCERKEVAGRGATRGVETGRGAGEMVREAPWRGTGATIRLLRGTAGGRAAIGTTPRSARGRVTREMISRKLVAVAGTENESGNNYTFS